MTPRTSSVREIGWFVLRAGIGAMFMLHGWPKLSGGPEMWAKVGQWGMEPLGVTFGYPVWGFLAACAEFFGGVSLVVGLLVRPFALLMLLTMVAAVQFKLSRGESWMHPAEMGIVALSIFIAGSGRLALNRQVRFLSGKWYG